MPRYLRWLAAITSGIIIQFSFFIAVGALAVGTGNKRLSGGIGLLVSLGSALVPMIGALAINDWLRTRYPQDERPSMPVERTDTPAVSER